MSTTINLELEYKLDFVKNRLGDYKHRERDYIWTIEKVSADEYRYGGQNSVGKAVCDLAGAYRMLTESLYEYERIGNIPALADELPEIPVPDYVINFLHWAEGKTL